ncbi:MAG: electron transport complex subunit RsxC [Candidatus Cloacimonadaceae bacterium]
MRLKTFPGGSHPPDQKHFSSSEPITELPLAEKVVIHLSQHIGAPSTPLVKVGDEVKKGDLIAGAAGFVSLNQHASISGKISKIGKFLHPTGIMSDAIEITSDGKNEAIQLADDEDYLTFEPEILRERIAKAGICGMGGAGFPTHVKLSPPKEKPIDTVILNGVECEPYLTSDHRLMLEKGEEIIAGLKVIMRTVGASKGIVGIEENKPDAIDVMQKLCAKEKDLSVIAFRLQYPQGAEKQLIYAATRRKVPAGGLPMEVGVVVQNVGTAHAIYEAVRYQKPLVNRVISVTGSMINSPKNLRAPIGTLFTDLVDFCGGLKGELGKAISGGPMMGFALPSLEASMGKGSSGLVLLSLEEAHSIEEHTCIRCARCVDACPMNLMPLDIVNAVKYDDVKMAIRAGLGDCIKCGSCAFVCPAHIRLVQWIDTGKIRYAAELRN